MNINSLSSFTSPLQLSYGHQPLDNAQSTNEIRGGQNTTDPPSEALQRTPAQTPDAELNRDFKVNISQEARATFSAANQPSDEPSLTASSRLLQPETESLQDSRQTQQEQLQQQQNASYRLYNAASASPYAAAQAAAASPSIDLIA